MSGVRWSRLFVTMKGMADRGAGHPDFGLYAARQVLKGLPRKDQLPERGVVEVKSPGEDMLAAGVRDQVARYRNRYRLVLVTNLREFALAGLDADGGEVTLERFCLADNETEFYGRLEKPRAFAREAGAGLGEYLRRVLSHRATQPTPLQRRALELLDVDPAKMFPVRVQVE